MEISTVMMKNINGRLSHQQSVSQSRANMDHSSSSFLPNYISFPQKPALRDASFNSYLMRPDHHDHPNNTIQVDDSEISIFDAQKYFNESNNIVDPAKVITSKRVSPVNVINEQRRSSTDVSASLPRFSSASSVDGYARNYRARSFNATPTASSEASWNSQTGLLSNPPGAIAISMRTPEKKKGSSSSSCSSKWLFRRNLKCPCSGKKSVQVKEKLSSVSEPKTPARLYNKKQTHHKPIEIISSEKNFPSESEFIIPNSTRRISAENRFPSLGLGQRMIAPGRPYSTDAAGFTFPILNQTSSMKLVLDTTTLPLSTNPSLEDPPRESLEIFQPPSDEITVSRKSTDLNLQNRMLVSRQSFTFPASPSRTRMTSMADDDVASDASSDLFEIESFSTQTTSCPMYNNRRDSLDEASSFNARRLAATNSGLMYCTRGSLDEPVTPSIAATECYEPSEASIDWSVTTAEGFDRGSVTNFSITASEIDEVRQDSGGGGNKKKGNGMLLSCRCEKAVSVVGPNPVKCVAGSGIKHVGSRTHNVKPPVARSQSDRLSLPFAT